jgi:hypothetical protein
MTTCKACGRLKDDHNVRHPFIADVPETEMTPDAIRDARNSFAMQLTNMIRDFERQTGKTIQGINVERSTHKSRIPGQYDETISLFKGVYLAIE